MISRLVSLTTAAALVGAALGTTPAAAVAGFGDVRADTFYSEPVQWLVDEDLTTGTSPGCFSPERSVTRGEIVTFLWRYAGRPASTSEPFRDVNAGDFFQEAVAWASSAAITTGTTATTFEPHRYVTRGETATFLWRFRDRPPADDSPFVDVDEDRYDAPAVAWLVSAGITTGTSPTTFNPDRPLTRGEAATFLHRLAGSSRVEVDPTGACGPARTGGFETLPPGAALPSGDECAARVRFVAEHRPDNAVYNATTGSGPHPDYPRVDGDFTGTTDEILQWAACKWGIDEDIVRAQAAVESWWHQGAGGDYTFDSSRCHPSVRHLSPCPQSLGIFAVKYRFHVPAMDDAVASTAYNADYSFAAWRRCFEGRETWLDGTGPVGYRVGDLWGCVGAHWAGAWRTAGAIDYVERVQDEIVDRPWDQPRFADL